MRDPTKFVLVLVVAIASRLKCVPTGGPSVRPITGISRGDPSARSATFATRRFSTMTTTTEGPVLIKHIMPLIWLPFAALMVLVLLLLVLLV